MKLFFFLRTRHFTFVELLVVLGILLLLLLIATSKYSHELMAFGPTEKNPFQLITEASLQTIHKTIMGDSPQTGYYRDMGCSSERMPQTLADLFRVPSSLSEEFQQFDSETRLGWRGPYLMASAIYGKKTWTGYEFRSGFESTYGTPEDPAVLDAWGNPIILQIEFDGIPGITSEEAKYARLVSAGPDGILNTLADPTNMLPGTLSESELTLEECQDDLLFFLQIVDTRG